ncbi:receptor_IA-2 domain-containing protein [Trichonephila inaurata madagascariensis]|uniref:Receptor_IA-2 domain-containing protein n=1 Tax=Trichonephila inaurata madagascariensis TaxID=2747483 RepID=A0A8X6XSB8_9ARAC|nr:receptor_IA-2 domain-containing protein [Trichonephila inaurata madagascariensis]
MISRYGLSEELKKKKLEKNEIRRIYVADASDEHDDTERKDKTPAPKTEPEAKGKAFERISADQPEVIEGIDDFGTRDEEKTANAAKTGEGHMGRFDSVDATRANLVIKEKSPSEENALNLVKALEKFLELDRGSFSNVKVKGQRITFKVNPNSKGYNATEVATKAVVLGKNKYDFVTA